MKMLSKDNVDNNEIQFIKNDKNKAKQDLAKDEIKPRPIFDIEYYIENKNGDLCHNNGKLVKSKMKKEMCKDNGKLLLKKNMDYQQYPKKIKYHRFQ